MASSNSLFGEYETKVKYISASWLGSPPKAASLWEWFLSLAPASCTIQHLSPLCPRHCATASRNVYSVQHAWGPCSDSSEWGNVVTVPHLNSHPSGAHPPLHGGYTLLPYYLYTHSPSRTYYGMCLLVYLAFGSIGLTRISLANQHLINLTNAAKYFETRWARCCCSFCSSWYTRYPWGRRVYQLCITCLFVRMKS